MIDILVNADDVARVRFTSDATWETLASLCVINHPARHPLHARLRQRLPSRPRFDLGLLLELTRDTRWQPDLLAPKPLAKPPAPLEQLSALPDRVPTDVIEADLVMLRRLAPNGRAAAMTPDQLVERAAAALCGYWRAVLEPLWERVEALVSAEIARCSVALVTDGFAAALAGMHDQLSYSTGVITVETSAHELRVDAEGCGLWFIPSVFKWPGILVEHSGREPVISYAARGAGLVWDRSNSEQADGLTQLIGQSRARILAFLDVPRGTTALAGLLDLAPATVSSHLSVLSTAGLLTSHREGRRVLYARTELAARLLGLSQEAGDQNQPMDTPA